MLWLKLLFALTVMQAGASRNPEMLKEQGELTEQDLMPPPWTDAKEIPFNHNGPMEGNSTATLKRHFMRLEPLGEELLKELVDALKQPKLHNITINETQVLENIKTAINLEFHGVQTLDFDKRDKQIKKKHGVNRNTAKLVERLKISDINDPNHPSTPLVVLTLSLDDAAKEGLLGGDFFKAALRSKLLDKIMYLEEEKLFKTVDEGAEGIASQTGLSTPYGLDMIDNPLDYTYRYGRTGKGINVYVLDTGILETHVDFQNRGDAIVQNLWSAFPDESSSDLNGHGTNVAGIIGGTRSGAAKDANLYGIKVLDAEGNGSTGTLIDGLKYVLNRIMEDDDDYLVCCMSLGGAKSSLLDDIVTRMANAGATMVVAAGNDDKDACDSSPSSAEGSLTVGAVQENYELASFSNWGACVHIFAPGDKIPGPYVDASNPTKNDVWAYVSGTSQAAPHVAGIAAMIYEDDPTRTYAQVHGLIEKFGQALIQGDLKKSPNLLAQSPYVTTTHVDDDGTYVPDENQARSWLQHGAVVFAAITVLCAAGVLFYIIYIKKQESDEETRLAQEEQYKKSSHKDEYKSNEIQLEQQRQLVQNQLQQQQLQQPQQPLQPAEEVPIR